MANPGLLHDLGQIASRPASIPALRVSLLLCAVLAGLAWANRRPRLALLSAAAGGFAAVFYWMVQIASPLGLGTDPALTLAWAQAGVNALAEPKGAGFVWGTEPRASLVSAAASAGVSLDLVVLLPQLAALMGVALIAMLPFAFSRSRTSSTLAATLALGGGLWPGMAPYGAILSRPSLLLYAGGVVAALGALMWRKEARRKIGRSRLLVLIGLIVVIVIERALQVGWEQRALAALSPVVATIVLTSPLRAALRVIFRSSKKARRGEALLLMSVLGGSGLIWWDPPETVAGFKEARDENAALLQAMDWIRGHVPAGSVVLASPAYSAPIAALAGRRVLFPPIVSGPPDAPLSEPFRRARLLETTRRGAPVERLAQAFSVTHLFLGPGEPTPKAGDEPPPNDEPRMTLVLEYEDAKDFRVFRLAKK